MRDELGGLLTSGVSGGIQPLPGSEPLQKEYNRLIRQYRRELKTGAARYDLLAQAARLRVLIFEGDKPKR